MLARSRVEILPHSPLRHWRKRFRMTSKQNQMLTHPCGLEARKIKMKTDFGNGQTAVPGTLKLRQSPWKKRPQGTVSNSSEMELTIGELMIALKRTISCAAKSTVLVLILVSIRSLMLWMNLRSLCSLSKMLSTKTLKCLLWIQRCKRRWTSCIVHRFWLFVCLDLLSFSFIWSSFFSSSHYAWFRWRSGHESRCRHHRSHSSFAHRSCLCGNLCLQEKTGSDFIIVRILSHTRTAYCSCASFKRKESNNSSVQTKTFCQLWSLYYYRLLKRHSARMKTQSLDFTTLQKEEKLTRGNRKWLIRMITTLLHRICQMNNKEICTSSKNMCANSSLGI